MIGHILDACFPHRLVETELLKKVAPGEEFKESKWVRLGRYAQIFVY